MNVADRTKQYMSDVAFRSPFLLYIPGVVAAAMHGPPEGVVFSDLLHFSAQLDDQVFFMKLAVIVSVYCLKLIVEHCSCRT